MNFKSFIKSTSFKSIVVLLCTLLISGVFLTFANALLKVTDQERFDRAISKIYGKSVTTTEQTIADEHKNLSNATIDAAYAVEDGNYLIKATGKGGFSGGTTTCWIVIKMNNGAIAGVDKVAIESNVNQSYIGKITDTYLASFTSGYKEDIVYDTDDGFVQAGASYTSESINNAVNGAIAYIKAAVLGEEVVVETIFDSFAYTTYIDKEKTAAPTYADGVVTYNIVTAANGYATSFELTISVGADKKVSSLEITKNGSTEGFGSRMHADIATLFVGKDAAEIEAIVLPYVSETTGNFKFAADEQLSTGATMSNFLVGYAALFATANYDNALATAFSYTTYIDKEKTAAPTCADGVVTYNIVTAANGYATSFELTISVGADKKVSSLEITKNGSTEGFGSRMHADIATLFVGKDAAEIEAIVLPYVSETTGNFKFAADEQLSTGATMSNFLVAYAALYATANYDLAVIVGGAN